MAKFPKEYENERVPDLSPEDFLRIVEATPVHARPCYWVVVLTGMRVGEYLGCTRFKLRRSTQAIDIPGTKPRERRDSFSVRRLLAVD